MMNTTDTTDATAPANTTATLDWQEAVRVIEQRTKGNELLLSCFYATNEDGGELIELEFWTPYGAKDEAQMYAALEVAEEVLGRKADTEGNSSGTRLFSWSRGDCDNGF